MAQRERIYRLIFAKAGSDYKRRIAYSYFDHALAKAAQNLVRGAIEYSIVEVITGPDGTKKDGVELAGGTREGNSVSFSVGRHASKIVKAETKPLWWPSWVNREH